MLKPQQARGGWAMLLAIALALGACQTAGSLDEEKGEERASASTSTPTPTPSPTPPPPPTPQEIAASRVPTELRAQVASLMMVGVQDFEDAKAKLEQGAGGIFIPSWADPSLLSEPGRDIATLREVIGRPFAVAIDFEGGRVQRHSQVLGNFPSARELAHTSDPAAVENLAYELGLVLRAHGITVDFAPVLDLDAAGLDVVGDRSYGLDPTVVGDYGAAFARGLNRAGVAPVYKHFPGHGRASGDTHHVTATTPPLEQLMEQDLRAFAHAQAGQEAAVMVGHLQVPGLTDASPASLNPAAYTLLREGNYAGAEPFAGVIYTDDLSGMRAISDTMTVRQAVTAAIAAGADQALWSSGADLAGVIDEVTHAVETGHIPAERITESAYRVQLQLAFANL